MLNTKDNQTDSIPKKILFYLLSKNKNDSEFKEILTKLLAKDVDINTIDEGGKTVLDVANFLPQYSSKAAILKKYDAKTSQELGIVPGDIGKKIIPGYEKEQLFAPQQQFDFEANGDLYDVDTFLEHSSSSALSVTNSVARQLQQAQPTIGLLMVDDYGVGTTFLIAPNLIMVSRHCLNKSLLSELTVQFATQAESIKIIGVVEEGISKNLDYAILMLETSVENVVITSLSTNRQPLLTTFIGYDIVGSLCFTNFIPTSPQEAIISSHQESFQQSSFGLSGSPYFDEEGCIYALHQNTGHQKKESLFIAEIFENFHKVFCM